MYLSLKITKYSSIRSRILRLAQFTLYQGKLWKFEVFWYEVFSWRRYRRSGWTRPITFRRLSPVGTCESGRLTLFRTIEPSPERRKIVSGPGC